MFKNEKGMSLIETLAAMAILGIIAVAFLSALATTSTARATNDERTSAKILAETLMENIKKSDYAVSYNPAVPPEFPGYTATVNTTTTKDGNLEIIIIAVQHHNHEVLTLESYKVNRK